eukprot:scaffold17088_cov127-Isochrysis_galbana.AAC.7
MGMGSCIVMSRFCLFLCEPCWLYVSSPRVGLRWRGGRRGRGRFDLYILARRLRRGAAWVLVGVCSAHPRGVLYVYFCVFDAIEVASYYGVFAADRDCSAFEGYCGGGVDGLTQSVISTDLLRHSHSTAYWKRAARISGYLRASPISACRCQLSAYL